jgi:hypothetical protein
MVDWLKNYFVKCVFINGNFLLIIKPRPKQAQYVTKEKKKN